jgi:hypothetical protein
MFIPDPNFFPSRIQQQQKRGGEKVCGLALFCCYKCHKIFIIKLFEHRGKDLRQLTKNLRFLTQKIYCQTLRNMGYILDPEKVIRDPGSGSRCQKALDTGSRTLLRSVQYGIYSALSSYYYIKGIAFRLRLQLSLSYFCPAFQNL